MSPPVKIEPRPVIKPLILSLALSLPDPDA